MGSERISRSPRPTRAPGSGRTAGPSRRWHGMTLIEVVITVAIAAIIAAVAFPSYVDHIRKMRRSDATQSLMRVDQELQRCYSKYRRFDNVNCDLVSAGPTIFLASREGYYQIDSIDSQGNETLTAESYTLFATPGGNQAGDDDCAELSLTSASGRGAEDSLGVDTTDLCWRQ